MPYIVWMHHENFSNFTISNTFLWILLLFLLHTYITFYICYRCAFNFNAYCQRFEFPILDCWKLSSKEPRIGKIYFLAYLLREEIGWAGGSRKPEVPVFIFPRLLILFTLWPRKRKEEEEIWSPVLGCQFFSSEQILPLKKNDFITKN